MDFVKALILSKNQIGYDDYAQEIRTGQKPAEDLPLLNALVNVVADIYVCSGPTIKIGRRTVPTVKAQALCAAITKAQYRHIIAGSRGAQLQEPITLIQIALLRTPLTPTGKGE